MKDIFENEYLFDFVGREPDNIQRRLRFFEDLGCLKQDESDSDLIYTYKQNENAKLFIDLFKVVIKPNIDTYYIVN